MRALCLIRPALVYRREAFCAGLRGAGYEVVDVLRDPGPSDVLVIWNRYAQYDDEARRFEAAYARVIVAENGYLRDGLDGKWFALSLGHHSGAGTWRYAGPKRWDDLGVELQHWRWTGSEIVILGQRGIGEPGIAAPKGWAESVQRKIGGRIRPHPGNRDPSSLEDDLAKASAVVTWHSAAALSALVLGIPVYCAFPQWIGMQAATPLEQYGMAPKRNDADRLAMFRRLIWAQWRLTEIESGDAFRHLLG